MKINYKFYFIKFSTSIARQEVRSLETEIVGYKKSTQKAEEKNETLTVRLNKMRNERDMVKSSIQGCLERQDSLKQQYATYSRTLHETEHNYNKALMVCVTCFVYY